MYYLQTLYHVIDCKSARSSVNNSAMCTKCKIKSTWVCFCVFSLHCIRNMPNLRVIVCRKVGELSVGEVSLKTVWVRQPASRIFWGALCGSLNEIARANQVRA